MSPLMKKPKSTSHNSPLSTTRKAKKGRSRLSTILPYLVLLGGLMVLMWPVINSWIEAWQAEEHIGELVATYDEMSDPERAALRAEARRYNEALAIGADLNDQMAYEHQLSFQGSEMIAYVAIPKCSIRLPVYHGTEDRVLMAGVGHLKNTSLPAGGQSSHCVLTAHTGMPGRRMFDDIHLLELGDEFVVWVLGEPLAYRVYATEVVLPDKVDSLRIQEGRDLCTLITCTPYGVNSHRLLVHAERCAYDEGAEGVPDINVYINNRTLPLLIAAAAILALGVFLGVRGILRKRKRKKAKGLHKAEVKAEAAAATDVAADADAAGDVEALADADAARDADAEADTYAEADAEALAEVSVVAEADAGAETYAALEMDADTEALVAVTPATATAPATTLATETEADTEIASEADPTAETEVET